MADIKYDIVEELGVLSESAKGWQKELNGIVRKQNTICVIGRRTVRKWEKE